MSVVTGAAKHAIRDKIAAELESAGAKLLKLKAEAENAKADFELAAITELITKQHDILHKLRHSEK